MFISSLLFSILVCSGFLQLLSRYFGQKNFLKFFFQFNATALKILLQLLLLADFANFQFSVLP